MWPFNRKRQRYEIVAGDEEDSKIGPSSSGDGIASQRNRCSLFISVGAATALLVLVGVAYYVSGTARSVSKDEASQDVSKPASGPARCKQRHEWRALTSQEQQDYISAVLCLRSRPSTLSPDSNRTAYDDFPWIHSHVGYYTHNSAPFLPWHRYFLHIYESTLRDQCGYDGGLIYWDWTLDSEALERSPVFSPASGFGGDGEVGGEIQVGVTGRCLADGPFAGIVVDYYDVKLQPHCLSRGFRDLDGNLGHMNGRDISPKSIDEVLSLSEYEGFVTLMESRVHDAIPFAVGGDFETFTAPYDPLFFLHHTQLDRLWWLWQQRQPEQGLYAYNGHKQRHSMKMASLADELDMQALAPNVKVVDVMDVQGDLLCYSY